MKIMYDDRYPSFEEIIDWELECITEESNIVEPSIIRRGFYFEQIKHWLDYFDKSSFLFIENKELEPEKLENTLMTIVKFLGIGEFKLEGIDLSKKNAQSYTRNVISAETKSKLYELFKERNKGLSELIQLKLEW